MSVLMASNLILQMTPCYTMEKYNGWRVAFYVFTLMICLGLALFARLWIATAIEVDSFYTQLILSFVYLGIGFVFY
jgi:hypothetical protein